jgi:hypothetical protein
VRSITINGIGDPLFTALMRCYSSITGGCVVWTLSEDAASVRKSGDSTWANMLVNGRKPFK